MKKLIITLFLFTSISYSQSLEELDLIMGLNVGVALDNNESNFVSKYNYTPNSFYENSISFVELTFSSTDHSSFNEDSKIKTASSLTFKYFYPIYSTDSIATKYSGNLFGLDIVGLNLTPNKKWVNFVVSAGLNMGSKKVRVKNTAKYKNWIFAPRATADLKFIFSDKFAITFKAEQQYDVTKGRFKLKKGSDVLSNLEGFKYHALMISGGIGWKL